MNANFWSLLPLVLAAISSQNATFPITVGGRHVLVNITRNPTPGRSHWFDAFQVVARILAGQTGSLTVGVFSITITPLTDPSAGAPPSGVAAGIVPAA